MNNRHQSAAKTAHPSRQVRLWISIRTRLVDAYCLLAAIRYDVTALFMLVVLRLWPRTKVANPRDRDIISEKLILMPVISDLRIDPRVERAARTAVGAGFRVKVVFPDTFGMRDGQFLLDWGPGVEFVVLPWRRAIFLSGAIGLYDPGFCDALSRETAAIIHAHDLNTSLIALLASRRNGAKVMTDFHEWWSENVHWDQSTQSYVTHGFLSKWTYRELERICLRDVDEVITVCDSIAEVMSEELGNGRRPVVVRNIPQLDAVATRDYLPVKAQFGLSEDRFLLLYQGGTGPTRLIEPIIEALAYAPECTLLIRGPSLDLFGEGYRALAAKVGAADRLILAPPVPSRDVVAAARGADAGVYSVLGVGKNFYYALPNKIFEYMAAGLPVLAADYPEARRLVNGENVGVMFNPYDAHSIASAINGLIENPERLRALAEAVPAALARINAEAEWGKLAEVYIRLAPSENV